MGAPAGNINALKDKRWYEALDRAIKQDEGKRLRAAAEKLLDLAADGEAWAVKELGDRLDGKPKQQTEISGPDGGPVDVRVGKIERVIADPKTPNP
jgi:hypothetical protein